MDMKDEKMPLRERLKTVHGNRMTLPFPKEKIICSRNGRTCDWSLKLFIIWWCGKRALILQAYPEPESGKKSEERKGKKMKLLPSETRRREMEIRELVSSLEEGDRIHLSEPCDCGSHIRHNNGGNYHDEITIAIDSGKFYIKNDSTCELNEPAEWVETTLDALILAAKGFAEDGMYQYLPCG